MVYIILDDIIGTRIKKISERVEPLIQGTGGEGVNCIATFNNISVIYKGNWVEMFVECYIRKLNVLIRNSRYSAQQSFFFMLIRN